MESKGIRCECGFSTHNIEVWAEHRSWCCRTEREVVLKKYEGAERRKEKRA